MHLSIELQQKNSGQCFLLQYRLNNGCFTWICFTDTKIFANIFCIAVVLCAEKIYSLAGCLSATHFNNTAITLK